MIISVVIDNYLQIWTKNSIFKELSILNINYILDFRSSVRSDYAYGKPGFRSEHSGEIAKVHYDPFADFASKQRTNGRCQAYFVAPTWKFRRLKYLVK